MCRIPWYNRKNKEPLRPMLWLKLQEKVKQMFSPMLMEVRPKLEAKRVLELLLNTKANLEP